MDPPRIVAGTPSEPRLFPSLLRCIVLSTGRYQFLSGLRPKGPLRLGLAETKLCDAGVVACQSVSTGHDHTKDEGAAVNVVELGWVRLAWWWVLGVKA
jgi:hypothetical protein